MSIQSKTICEQRLLTILLIHAFHQMPEPQRIHFLFIDHHQTSAFQDRVQCQIGSESNMLTQGRNPFLYRRNNLITIDKVIQHNDPSKSLTHSNHFVHHTSIIRNGRDDVSRHHNIIVIIRKIHFPGIHSLKGHMIQAVLLDPTSSMLQHAI